MLAGAWYTETNTPITLGFSGLTVGHMYLLQIWVADFREYPNARTETIATAAGEDINVPILHFLTGNGSTRGTGMGQYAIGTFTATSPDLTFNLIGNESYQLNAFQLRDLTPTATPLITVSMAGTNVTLSWPAAYIGWTLQVQTNISSTGIPANWVNVPGTASSNSKVVSINPAAPPMLYRLREP